ncbi:VanW family protein [Alkalicoccobacillus plakortidis]|uniref:VanW family protein n=1 Tax=Alkalicoccobacillus plakortidis TaxID=444060 RepID=A0ABT0XH14_9BACI|nr:VanW family protein [Alkalicoccobacillus plakortidis]MCM2675182.1 VanW family protein [Alkalicoccobacillus plakortidis]
MKSFVRIGLLVAGMIGILLIGLFAGRVLDQQAIAKEYQVGTVISGIEVGGLTPEEAQVELEKLSEQRKSQQGISLYLYDSKVELPREALILDIPTLTEDVLMGSEQLDAMVDITALTEALAQIESADLTGLVDISTLKTDLELQLNEQPSKPVSVHLAPYIDMINEDSTVLSNVYTPYLESTLLGQWAKGLDGIIIDPKSTFSLKETLKQSNQLVVGGESLDLFASAIYQVLAKSNLELIEHHSPSKLPYSIEIGYSASVNEDYRDLVFYNPNYETLELKTQFSQDGLIVELIGTPYLHEYELVVEDTETIQPRKEVRYSKKRRAGDSQLIVNGKQGYAATLHRKELGPNKTEKEMVLLARDYVAAVSSIEERSVYSKPEPEPKLNEAGLQPVIVELPEGSENAPVVDPVETAQPSTDEETKTTSPDEDQEYIKGVYEPGDEEQDDEN